VYELGPDRFRDDLRASLRVLRSLGAGTVSRFRAPEWSINERSLWALDTLAGEGIAVDASMAPLRIVGDVRYPRYPHIRRTGAGPITEVPPLVADRFRQVMPMGWGWGLRMSSPRRILRTIDAANRAGRPAVLTVHPWELDPDPPRVRLPTRLRFAHYFRLSGFGFRLNEVLKGAAFGGIGEFLSATPNIPTQ
jgi:peptidoglycan/xylan/chitin deacetylase (PgdA/CDA1 family)